MVALHGLSFSTDVQQILSQMQTIIWRHRRENLKKCSLRGLEGRDDFAFFTYPTDELPDLGGYVALSFDGPPLTREDAASGLLLIDGTWRYAERMAAQLPPLEQRSLPTHFQTAYPRRQGDCSEPSRGLASIEALYLALTILGRDTTGLLDGYHWGDRFFDINGLAV
jgi:rRNA small subunit aminocarboxypropyltransferase